MELHYLLPFSTPSVPLSTPSVPSTLEYPSSSSQPRRSGPIGVCRAAPPQHDTAPFAAPSPCKMRRCDRLLAGGGLAPAGLCYSSRVAAVGERLCTDARACTAGGRNGSLLSVGGERRPRSELSFKASLAVFADRSGLAHAASEAARRCASARSRASSSTGAAAAAVQCSATLRNDANALRCDGRAASLRAALPRFRATRRAHWRLRTVSAAEEGGAW
jgi:hypothetical protein